MKKVNRGVLRKLVDRNEIVMVSSYHFDDCLGEDRTANRQLPVRMMPEDRHNCQPGICYLFASDFKSKSGCAYESDNGSITLIVHSNCSYTLKRLKGGAA